MKQLYEESITLSDLEEKSYELLKDFKSQVVRFEEEVKSNREDLPRSRFDTLQTSLREFLFQLENTCRDSPLDWSSMKTFVGSVQRELLPYLLLSENARRWYEKPRGFSGDYLTMRNLYNHNTGGTGAVGLAIDEALLNLPPVKSVRNRRNFLRDELLKTIDESQSPPPHCPITSLACGAALEVFDVFETLESDPPVQFALLDMDREAIDHVENSIDELGVQTRAQTFQKNLIFLVKGRHELDIGPQELIYSAGLIDYFDDEFVGELLDWIYDKLATGGRLILGNFHPRNPTRAFMDHILDWKLVYRTMDDMHRLSKDSKFNKTCSKTWFEENEINLFAELTKE